MFEILAEIFKTFISEIAKKLVGKSRDSDKVICQELGRLYLIMEELMQQATSFYQTFEHYVVTSKEAKGDADLRRTLRIELRELLDSLKRYEKHVKKVFVKLKLLDDSDLSIKLVEVPESSYNLFKTYFVDDLAPKFIADKSDSNYVLRLTRNKTSHKLVDVNQLGHISLDLERLFKEGHLSYEVVDISNEPEVSGFLRDFSRAILKLKSATESLKTLILTHCKLEDIF